MQTVRTPDTLVDDPDELPTREQLLALVTAMQRDWVQLNVYLNATAMNYGWCSQYEQRLNGYNQGFEVMRLEGRPGGAYLSVYGGSRDYFLLDDYTMRRLRIIDVRLSGQET